MHNTRKILSAGTHGIQERLQVQFGKQRELSDKYSFQGVSIPIRLPNKNAAITNRDKCLERNGSIFCLLGNRILHIKYAHNHNTGKGYGNAGVVLPAQLLF